MPDHLSPHRRLALAPAPEHASPAALPAFAAAPVPWCPGERVHGRIVALGAGGMTLRLSPARPRLLPGAELELGLDLGHVAGERAHGRIASVAGDEIRVEWIDPSRALHGAISRYLLAGDPTLTPAALRASGLKVGSIESIVTHDEAATPADYEEILALRLHAHQAEGHLEGATVEDMRSPFDAHARHLTCRFGGRIVGYVRVILVDGVPDRSQYVTLGGHAVPPWLWRAGFVEGGAGAVHPDFQRAGLFVQLILHATRVMAESGHRYMLGACEDGLLGMYAEMGFEKLEERICEPKPGWRFRSHLIHLDARRLLREPPATKTLAAMAAAVGSSALPAAA